MPLGAHKAAIMGVAGVSDAANVVLLATNNITSGVAASAFTSGLTSTYGEYIFKFYTMHPATNDVYFEFNVSIDGGSNYNVVKTTTFFQAQHSEDNSEAGLSYKNGDDLAQGTGYVRLATNLGNDADQHCAGELHLFNPASTTYVKHFYSRAVTPHSGDLTNDAFIGGYANTTTAVNAISFQMSSGNIDIGKIKMWGVT